MKHLSLRNILLSTALFTFSACGEEVKKESTTEEKWVNLLSGESVNDHWQPASNRAGNRKTDVGERWTLKDGILQLKRKEEMEGRGGSIETKEAYFNFELQFEFKVDFNSNGGIKYRQKHSTGFEYQITDDFNYKDNGVSHRTAELYEIQEEETPRIVKKHGEWNTGKIIAKGNHLEHWLNGKKVFDLEIGSEDWKKRFEDSKYFKQEIKDFGTHTGSIHLQDHSDTGITFRKLRIKEL